MTHRPNHPVPALLAGLLVLAASALQADTNVALGKTYKASAAASTSFPDTGRVELTDGRMATSALYTDPAWQGRQTTSYSHTVDLGTAQTVNRVVTDFMADAAHGIVYPTSVTCRWSNDGSTFYTLGSAAAQPEQSGRRLFQWTGTAVTARYVRVLVKGGGSWLFQGEVQVWSPGASTTSAPTSLSYPVQTLVATVGQAIPTDTPTVTGTVTSWSISPSLPAGLAFSTTNGAISGTPTVQAAASAFTVTAANAYGATSASFTVAVQAPTVGIPAPLHGVTVDDGWNDTSTNRTKLIAALKACPVKPTVRIVMDKAVQPSAYVSLFQSIHAVAYVMACPCDSTYMASYTTVDAYRKRFSDSVAALGPYVDLWEVGNEINGEGWLGNDPQFIADKMVAAYAYIKGLGLKTVLTPYEFRPGDQSISMEAWLLQYVPLDMRQGVDYVMVSYYEDDNGGYQPSWATVFANLQTLFPNSKLGIGECGNTASNATLATKTAMANHYYQMPKYLPSYVGGYFWWYWAEDCVLSSDATAAASLKATIDADMAAQPQ